jgi:cation:H+ antiporter
VVGSCIFNVLGILGISSLLAPRGLPVDAAMLSLDIPVMIGVVLLCLPIVYTGSRVTRGEGALLVGMYVAYTSFLVLRALEHAALDEFRAFMLLLAVPAVVLIVIVATARFWLETRRVPASE